MKQTIDDNFSNSRASNISPQFPSGSRPPSPYRYFNRQGSQNTFNRSLSLFRSYVSFLGQYFQTQCKKIYKTNKLTITIAKFKLIYTSLADRRLVGYLDKEQNPKINQYANPKGLTLENPFVVQSHQTTVVVDTAVLMTLVSKNIFPDNKTIIVSPQDISLKWLS